MIFCFVERKIEPIEQNSKHYVWQRQGDWSLAGLRLRAG